MSGAAWWDTQQYPVGGKVRRDTKCDLAVQRLALAGKPVTTRDQGNLNGFESYRRLPIFRDQLMNKYKIIKVNGKAKGGEVNKRRNTFSPHASHEMASNRITFGGPPMSKDHQVAFDGVCLGCGARVWGETLSFDYDSRLAKKCKKPRKLKQ